MTLANLLSWIASFKKRKVANPPTLVSDVRCAAGHPAKKTSGLVPVGMNGTRSIQEASAQPACTSGLKLNAFRVADGRRTQIGTGSRDC